MERKLNKTLLSRKPSSKSLMTGLMSLAVLALFFGADQNIFSANGHQIFQEQEYWRAFTTSLLHADLTHLAHNAFFFTALAALINGYYGFWVFPVLCFLAGGLINMITLYFYPPHVYLVGISGVVYFMASFWLTLYLMIEKRQPKKVRILHAFAVSLIFFFPEMFQERVSYLAHGVGFALGIPAALMWYWSNRPLVEAREEWVEVKKDHSMEDTILLDENSFHWEKPEEAELSSLASDSSQFRRP